MDGDAMYLRDGDGFVGTILTQGGWDRGGQNGACVLSLLGHCLEDVPSLTPMLMARMSVDLVRQVPIGQRFHVRPAILREGKKIQVVQLELVLDDLLHARATVLRLREQDVSATPGLSTSSTDEDPARELTPPDRCERMDGRGGPTEPPAFLQAVEMRRARYVEGPGYGLWVRFDKPVVEGEPIRATSRLALGFDFVNLINVEFDIDAATMINPDVSAHVLRRPTGEWMGVTGDTRFAPDLGRGMSIAHLSDAQGVFGVASASQLVQPR